MRREAATAGPGGGRLRSGRGDAQKIFRPDYVAGKRRDDHEHYQRISGESEADGETHPQHVEGETAGSDELRYQCVQVANTVVDKQILQDLRVDERGSALFRELVEDDLVNSIMVGIFVR